MKVEVCLRKKLFDRAEQLAKWKQMSRNRIYAAALREYIERHESAAITKSINRVIDKIGNENAGFIAEAARRTLMRMKRFD
jgi:hypothetical protein